MQAVSFRSKKYKFVQNVAMADEKYFFHGVPSLSFGSIVAQRKADCNLHKGGFSECSLFCTEVEIIDFLRFGGIIKGTMGLSPILRKTPYRW